MSAVAVQVADAVVDHLAGAPFMPAVVAQRSWLPQAELAALSTLHVTVTPVTMTIEPATRSEYDFLCRVEVGVQKKVDPADGAAIDALAQLVQDMVDHLQGPLPAMPAAELTEIGNAPIVSREHLLTDHVFTSVVAVTYRVRR